MMQVSKRSLPPAEFGREQVKSLQNLVALVMLLHPITHFKYLSNISPDNPNQSPVVMYDAIMLVIRSEAWFRNTLRDFIVAYGFNLSVNSMDPNIELYVAAFNSMLNKDSTILPKFNAFFNSRYQCTAPKPAPPDPEDPKVARIIAQVHERKIDRFILSKAFKHLKNLDWKIRRTRRMPRRASRLPRMCPLRQSSRMATARTTPSFRQTLP